MGVTSTPPPAEPVPQRTLAHLRSGGPDGPRGDLAKAIPRRPRVTWWLGLIFAVVFALLAMPSVTADRWLGAMGVGNVRAGERASITVRVPAIAGFDAGDHRLGGGGIVIARGEVATVEAERTAASVSASSPHGALPYVALFLLVFVLGLIFTHHMRRSTRGRLIRVQVVSLVSLVVLAIAVKTLLLTTSVSVLVVPVALLAIVPTLALDRIVGLATGVLAALLVALLGPFDVGVSILLLVQASVAGLVVAEQPKDRWRAVLTAGALTTLCTAATYLLLTYLSTGGLRPAQDPLHSAWLAAALGPAIATVLAVPLLPLYQLLVGEITRGKLIELEDLSNPLLKQIAEKAPGTWQHSLMMANLAEIAANAIGASGRLVRVGAYYHDLGKSLQPKYFIENLDPGETSPHDKLSPEVSCDAIFAHVTEGLVAARKAGLHERIVDFMHMHHGNGVLEYFWGRCKEQGNPRGFTQEHFRYPGHPPQSRETAILAICDAVEAASRTLKKPDAQSIDALVQRIVYGKLHLGQLDESGLSMSDLRLVSDSLRETIRHANHGRIEYPWQKAQQDASASKAAEPPVSTSPRLDSLDRAQDRRETSIKATPAGASSAESTSDVALAATADLKHARASVSPQEGGGAAAPEAVRSSTEPAPALVREVQPARQSGAHRIPTPPPISESRRKATVEPVDAPTASPPSRVRPNTDSEDLHARRAGTDTGDLSLPILAQEGIRLERSAKAPPSDSIAPALREDQAPARKRAATLPPTPIRRAPTVPPPIASRRVATIPPSSPISRLAGPPSPVDLENAVTNPPPLRPTPKPALLVVDDSVAQSDVTSTGIPAAPPAEDDEPIAPPHDAGRTAPFPRLGSSDLGLDENSRTNPALARFPSAAAMFEESPFDSSSEIEVASPKPGAHDEWSPETPIIAPTNAELRSLLGSPDPTRQQSIEEIERLHFEARAAETPDPDLWSSRRMSATTEVDPDDIESAIEIAPPARRPTNLSVTRKKPE